MIDQVKETIEQHFRKDFFEYVSVLPPPIGTRIYKNKKDCRTVANATGLRYFRCLFCCHQWAVKFKRSETPKDAKRPARCPHCRQENNPYKTDVIAKQCLTTTGASR